MENKDNFTDSPEKPHCGAAIPVGVTIAWQQQQIASTQRSSDQDLHDEPWSIVFPSSTVIQVEKIRTMPMENDRTMEEEDAHQVQKKRKRKQSPSKSKSNNSRNKEKDKKSRRRCRGGYQKPVSSFQLFVAASLLYGACVWLPSGLGILLAKIHSLYYFYQEQQQRLIATKNPQDWWWSLLSPSSEWICRTYPVPYFLEFYVSLPSEGPPQQSTITVSSAVSYAASYFCPEHAAALQKHQPKWLLSPNTSFTDFHVVVTLSLCLALVRLVITLAMVPTSKGREQMRALVRCKSVNLLSQEYPLTPTQSFRAATTTTPSCGKRHPQTGKPVTQESIKRPMLPHLMLTAKGEGTAYRRGGRSKSVDKDDYANIARPSLDQANEAETMPGQDTTEKMGQKMAETQPLPSPSFLSSPPQPQDDDDDMSWDMDDETELDAVMAAIEAAQRIQEEQVSPADTADLEASDESSSSPEQQHLYAAPRRATALFRLLYSIAASFLAYKWFGTRPFWPPYVGGLAGGSTQACWDLSGTTFMTDGYLSKNDGGAGGEHELLKRYFLWQASYHWHAGAFHIFSLLLLLLSYSPGREQRYTEKESHEQQKLYPYSWLVWYASSLATTQSLFFSSNKRSLVHHTLALFLIGTAYVFSSLRRLGAIGMFAFDSSSIFLHALQLSMNTVRPPQNDGKGGHQPVTTNHPHVRLVQFLLYGCVMPSFVLCRFGIWPALWWSALTESRDWLLQLERTLFPGAALVLQVLWNTSMVLFLILNMVHLRRLWNHPHLRRILAYNPPKIKDA